ncbi:MAG: Gfo/Idh/MocA family oxidoreductase [Planctomycetaceae bacterium]|nr:Gfo/Idh/MocA family oxidoreductase [Planctomycetaceae bacterium]
MSGLSRRNFLENSMFAIAAAAGVGAAQPRRASSDERVGPNDKLRVAILGVNGRGQSHIGGFIGNTYCDVVALCDPDEIVGMTRVKQVEEKQGGKIKYFRDLRGVMEDPNIDVVTIATPNHWHSLATIWAVQAGKHVYCEKPVSHNVEEGRRAVQAIEKHGTIVQCGTQSRSSKAHQEAVQFLRSGGIGDVTLARGLCYKRRPSIGPRGNYDVPANVDYNIYLGPAAAEPLTRPRFHYDWHWQWNCGNGDLGNQGIHQMDIARWGIDADDLGERVVTYGGRLGYEDAGETANTEISIYDFSGGRRIIFETRGLETDDYRGAKIGVVFHGTKGYVVSTSDYSNVTAFDPDGNVLKKFEGGGNHFDNFVDAVRAKDASLLNCPFAEGHLSSALCHLGNISYRLGEQRSVAEIREALAKDADAAETIGRTVDHLKANQVNLDQTPMTLGPVLTLNGREEKFTGSLSDQANAFTFREGRGDFKIPSAANV